jgi:hypothetical protein
MPPDARSCRGGTECARRRRFRRRHPLREQVAIAFATAASFDVRPGRERSRRRLRGRWVARNSCKRRDGQAHCTTHRVDEHVLRRKRPRFASSFFSDGVAENERALVGLNFPLAAQEPSTDDIALAMLIRLRAMRRGLLNRLRP